MKVVILAAGKGSGLGNLAAHQPKCMLQFGPETIIERQLRMLRQAGVDDSQIILVTGYRQEKLADKFPVQTVYNPYYAETDNAYSLFLALQQVDEDTLILDSDLVFDESVLLVMLGQKENTVLAKNNDNYSYGATGIVVKSNHVEEIGKHVQSSLTYESIIYLKKDTVDLWKEELAKPKNAQTWYSISLNKIVKETVFRVAVTDERIMGIDTYFDYIAAKRSFKIEDFSILVTGASGLLGKKVFHILKRRYTVNGIQHKAVPQVFPSLNLTDSQKVNAYIELNRPQIIIHTAGIAEPEICDQDKDMARELNLEVVKILVEACRKYHIKLILISTDYVFDGERSQEYSHTTERHPKNYYGETKKAAEDVVSAYENSLIIRMPILYGYNDDTDKLTFPIKVIQSLAQRQTLYLDNKQIRYPVLIDEVAFSIEAALAKTGIIHITSEFPCTKYTWGRLIAQKFGFDSVLIQEDTKSKLHNRPSHVKLEVVDRDYLVSDIQRGTDILRKQLHCVFKLIYKSDPTAYANEKNIGSYRYQLGMALGKVLPANMVNELDCVMPVPSSGLYYAMGLATELKVPYVQGLVKPDASVRSFQLADLALREQTIRSKIVPLPDFIQDKTIALVDEAIFTGITLKVVCDMLKACGARKIYICIPTPVCNYRCRQYIQPERELLLEDICEEKLKNYFGVAEVYFQVYEKFEQSIADMANICCECFEGRRNTDKV